MEMYRSYIYYYSVVKWLNYFQVTCSNFFFTFSPKLQIKIPVPLRYSTEIFFYRKHL